MLYSQANLAFGSQTGRNGRGEPYVVLAVAAVPSISRAYFVVRATPLMDRLGVVAPHMGGGAWGGGGSQNHMHSSSPPQPLSHQQHPSSSPSCEWKIEAILMQQPPTVGGTSDEGTTSGGQSLHVDPMDDTLTRQDSLLSHLSLESPFPSPTVEFISCVTHDECPPVSPQSPQAPPPHQARGGGAPLPPLTLSTPASSPHDEMEREVATIVVVFKHADQADPHGGHGSPGCGPSQLAFLLSRNVMAFSIFRFADRNHRVGIPTKQGIQRPLYTYAMSQLADDVISPWPDELLGSLKSAKKGCSPAGAFPMARHISPESELGVSLNYHLNADASALTMQVYAKGADVEAVRGARKAVAKPGSAVGPTIGKKGIRLYETVGISTVVLLRGDTSPPRPIRGSPAGSPDNGTKRGGASSSPLGTAANNRGRRGESPSTPLVPITPTNNGVQTATTGSCPVFLAAALFPDITVSSIHSAGVPSASEQGYSIIAGCVESPTDSILLLSGLQASCRREAGQAPLPTSHLTLRSFSQDTSRGAFFVLAGGGKTTCCMIDPTASYVAVGTSLGRVFLVHFANNSRNGKVGAGELTHMFMASVSLPLHLMASVSHCSVVSLHPTTKSTTSSKKTTKRKLMLLAVSKSSKGCLFTGTVDGAPEEGSANGGGGGVSLGFYGELAGKLRGCQFFTPCSHNVIQIHSKSQPVIAPSDASPMNESPTKSPQHHHSSHHHQHQYGSPHHHLPEASDRALVCMMLVPQLEANCHCISLSEDTSSPFAPKQRSSDRTLCGSSSLVLALRERRKVNVTSVRTAYESDVGTFMGTGVALGGGAAGGGGSASHDAYAKLAYGPLLFVGTPLQWRDPLMAAFNNPNDEDDHSQATVGTTGNTNTTVLVVREDVPWVTPINEIPVVGNNLPPTPNGTTKTFLHTAEGLDVNADERCMDDTDPYLHHIKPLGSGTFGAVTLAVSRAFPDRSFAVKRVRKMASDNEFDQNMVRTFFQEALNVLTSIPRHDNVVKYYGIYDSSSYHNIVMELARHGSLDEALFPSFEKLPALLPTTPTPLAQPQHPKAVLHVPEPILINWLGQGLHGLNHLHTHGVVHRDVKAGNILLSEGLGGTTDRRLLWTDFGVSCVEGARSDNNAPSHTSAKTAMRTVIGTMGFTAPELLEHWGTTESARYSAVCDVWGLGVVFYCYITGIGWLTEGGCIGVATAPQEITDVCAGRLPTLLELKRAAEARHGGSSDDDGGDLMLGHSPSPAVSGIDGGGSGSTMRGFSMEIQYIRVLQLSDQFLSAIDAMMRVNREERITTANALRHPLFCESWLNTAMMAPTVTPSIHFHNERWEVCKKSAIPALATPSSETSDAPTTTAGGLLLLSEKIRSFNPPSSQQPQGGMLLLKVLVACTAQEEASEAIIRWMGCLITARNFIKTNVIGAAHMHPRILLPSQLERTISECNLRQLPRGLRLQWADYCKREFADPPTLPANPTTPTTTTFGSSCVLLGCVGQCDPFPTLYTAFEESHPLLTTSNYAPFKEAISQWKSLISNWGTHGRSALYPTANTTTTNTSGGRNSVGGSTKNATKSNNTDEHTSSDLTVAATELLQECVMDAIRAALASYRHALAASFLSDPACHHMLDIEAAFYHGGVVQGNVGMACPPPRMLEVCEAPLASVIGLAARSIVIGPPSVALTAQKVAAHSTNGSGTGDNTAVVGTQGTPSSSTALSSANTMKKKSSDHDLSDASLLLYDAGFHFGNRWNLASCLEALERG